MSTEIMARPGANLLVCVGLQEGSCGADSIIWRLDPLIAGKSKVAKTLQLDYYLLKVFIGKFEASGFGTILVP
ncbi:MAG: hypothetical protein JW936_00130 [Sedimentisphaerales bacterium]|nr:hypothetical protein [Sedimentisphaerales bacterium]